MSTLQAQVAANYMWDSIQMFAIILLIIYKKDR